MPMQSPLPSGRSPACTADARRSAGAYDAVAYLEHKGWGDPDRFGRLSPAEAAVYDAMIGRAGRRFESGARVLEVGFGDGAFLRFAAGRGWRVSGVEVQPVLVDVARRAGFDVWHAATLEAVETASVDLLVAFDVLEHLGPSELVAFMREVARVLTPAGRFVARFPNGDSPLGLVNQNGDLTHVSAIGSVKAKHLATVAGLALHWYGGEPPAPPAPGLRARAQRLASRLVTGVVNRVVNRLILPHDSRLPFCSANVVAVYRHAD